MSHPPSRLEHLAVLRLTGPDRVALLQGQTSNDATRVTATLAQLTSFNTPKGRCYAIAALAAWDDTHLLVTERSVAENLCKKLRMYILRSKVVVEIAADLAVLGATDAAGIAAAPGANPANPDPAAWAAAATDGQLAIRWPDGRSLLVAAHDRATSIADHSAAWRRADIAAGLPSVVAATSEHFVPLWLGLERLGAIDYKKGCYTGQEIVARTHYLGTVKQRLHRARATGPIAPGDKVYVGTDQLIGEVVAAAPDAAASVALIVARAAPPNSTLTVGTPAGTTLTDVIAFD